MLLNRGANIEARSNNGGTPLHAAAASSKSPDVIKLLLNRGADIEACNDDGRRPLHTAATFSDLPAVVEIFLDEGAKIDVEDKNGLTPYDYGMENKYLQRTSVIKRLEVMQSQLSSPDEVTGKREQRNEEDSDCAIQEVQQSEPVSSNLPMNERKEYQTKNQEAKNIDNNLLNSVFWRKAKVDDVTESIASGADINAKDKSGAMPLYKAVIHSKTPEVITLLLDRGADIDARFAYGSTALHWAVVGNTALEIIALLLDRGADVNAQDKNGDTPLHWVVRYNSARHEVISLLLDKGADIAAQNKKDEIPFNYAKENENLKETDVYHRLSGVQHRFSRDVINLRTVILTVLLGGFVGWLLVLIFS